MAETDKQLPGFAPGLDEETAKSSQDRIKQELFQAADHRIADLNKTGVAQGQSDISEPKCQYFPVLTNLEEYEDWKMKDLSEKGEKTRTHKTWQLETDRRLRRMKREPVGKNIEVNDILLDVTTHDGSTKECRHAMFIGPAGSGKTTLLRRITKYAREGKYEMLKDKLLVNVDLRTFPVDEEILPMQGLLGSTFDDLDSENMNQRYQWMLNNSEEVAFFIDSLDTHPFDLDNERPRIGYQEYTTSDVILHNLLAKDLFPKSSIISSSREYKVRNMHPSVRPDRCILLDGLKEESVRDLIDGFLGKDNGAKMKKYIDTECPDVWPLLSIPVFLAFSTISFAVDGFKPKTMSGILIKYFLCLIRSIHAHVKDIRPVLHKLMPMSFEGICKGQVLFPPEHLSLFDLTPELVTDLTSLIPQSHGTYLSSKLIQNDRFFLYFNHQTQQETLAALHVLSLHVKNFEDFVQRELYVATLGVLKRLVCGILLNDEVLEAAMELTEIADVDQKKTSLLESFRVKLDQLRKKPNKEELLELFIDFNEAKDTVREVIRSSVRAINFKNISLSPSDVQTVAFVMKQCEHLDEVNLDSCNLTAGKMEIVATPDTQSNLKLKSLDVDGNENIGSGGMFHLGRFVKNSRLEELSVQACGLKHEHLEKFAVGAEKSTTLKSLDVGFNVNIGCGGMFHLGRFVKNSSLETLSVSNCRLESKHLENFADGAENATFQKFDVSCNEKLGSEGMRLLGKLIKNHEVKELVALNCNPNAENVQKFTEGLGDATFGCLDLSYVDLNEGLATPVYVPALLNLLPHVNKRMSLQGWQINEIQQQELQDKLNEICSPTLSITLVVRSSPVELKASPRHYQTENQDDDSAAGGSVANLPKTTGQLEVGAEPETILAVGEHEHGAVETDELLSSEASYTEISRVASERNPAIEVPRLTAREKFILSARGAKIRAGSARVAFPPGMLKHDANIKVTVESGAVSDRSDKGIPISPTIGCDLSHVGLMPGLEMEVEMLTYCFAREPVPIALLSKASDSDDWVIEKEMMLGKDRKVKFKTSSFSRKYLIFLRTMRTIGLGRFLNFPVTPHLYYNKFGGFKSYICVDDKSMIDELETRLISKGFASALVMPESMLAKLGESIRLELQCAHPTIAKFGDNTNYKFKSDELIDKGFVERDFDLKDIPNKVDRGCIIVHLTLAKVPSELQPSPMIGWIEWPMISADGQQAPRDEARSATAAMSALGFDVGPGGTVKIEGDVNIHAGNKDVKKRVRCNTESGNDSSEEDGTSIKQHELSGAKVVKISHSKVQAKSK